MEVKPFSFEVCKTEFSKTFSLKKIFINTLCHSTLHSLSE